MALLHVSHPPAQTCRGEDILYIYFFFVIFPGHPEFWTPLQIPIWALPLAVPCYSEISNSPRNQGFEVSFLFFSLLSVLMGFLMVLFPLPFILLIPSFTSTPNPQSPHYCPWDFFFFAGSLLSLTLPTPHTELSACARSMSLSVFRLFSLFTRVHMWVRS